MPIADKYFMENYTPSTKYKQGDIVVYSDYEGLHTGIVFRLRCPGEAAWKAYLAKNGNPDEPQLGLDSRDYEIIMNMAKSYMVLCHEPDCDNPSLHLKIEEELSVPANPLSEKEMADLRNDLQWMIDHHAELGF